MDLASIVNLQRPPRLQISYKGCDEVCRYCEELLVPYFDHNVTSWKRQGRQFPFPLHVKFLLRFVPFHLDLLVDSNRRKWESIAFVHFYFMNPTSVEEYRSNSRHDVSEWFGRVSSAEGAEWIVVFDSTKAREKKNRGALIERIKSDFAKYSNRILEIHEGSAQCVSGLQFLMQTCLLSFLEYYVGIEETRLAAYKEHYKNLDFDYISYCDDQMQLTRLYHSLGVLEHVLAKFDELDALLSLVVASFANTTECASWLCKSGSSLADGCPLLLAMAHVKTPRHTMTLTELRSLILTHQILFSLRIYDERVRHAAENAPPNPLQMKSDFAAILLRYANHCVASVCENISTLNLAVDEDELQCWTVSFCIETMQFVSILCEVAHVEHASYFACSLGVRKCNAIAKLYESCDSSRFEKLAKWFERGVAACEAPPVSSNAVLELRQILTDSQQFTHFMQKYHESSIALLKHFGWKRQSKLLGYQLANFLLASDRVEGAVPYLLKFVTGIMRDRSSLMLLQKTLHVVAKHFEAASDLYFKELIEFFLLLSLRVGSAEERAMFARKLLQVLERNSSCKMRHTICGHHQICPVRVELCTSRSRFAAIPGDEVFIEFILSNELPLPLKAYSVRCFFVRVSVDAAPHRSNAGHRPLFECSYHKSDCVGRFGCVSKGDFGSAKESVDDELPGAGDADNAFQGTLVFEQKAEAIGDELPPGRTNVSLFCKVSDVGVYLLDYVEVEIADSLCVIFSWVDVPEIERDSSKRPICFVHRKAPAVTLSPIIGGYLLSGVAQSFSLEVCAGSEPVADSECALRVQAVKDDNIEFWNSRCSMWSDCFEAEVSSMSPSECRAVVVYVCLPLRNLVSNQLPEEEFRPPSTVIDICVRWCGYEWKFAIEFRPIVSIRTNSSLLEDKVLLEMQILRHQEDGWTVIPLEATLLSTGELPQVPAKLFNPKFTEIPPLSTFQLVWVLDSRRQTVSSVQEHIVNISYRVRPSTADLSIVPADLLDRIYVYRDIVALVSEKASYELCAQLLSSQPGAVLCRVDSACDFIVSLRSLTNRVETLAISVDADPRFWSINEKHKLMLVKESGLGQISFTVTPKLVGFLPYPSVAVYACHFHRNIAEKSSSLRSSQHDLGRQLASFVRSNGKQVHVLGAFSSSADQKSTTSEKSGRLKDAKTRLTKLFDTAN